ncbi:hypothetical protein FACS189452_07230 [Bacteroidia bacterium]|nr:hypothetical protein FACS189452_07230 [Bacteroidia bacterium]
MNKKLFFCISGVLLFASAAAQKLQHEFSLYGMGGLSSFDYSIDNATRKSDFGGGGGFGYAYNITDWFGLGTGIGASLYNGSVSIADGTEFVLPNLRNVEGNFIDLYSVFSKHTETQRAFYLNIPLSLNFNIGRYFYINTGYKLGIPVKGSYDVSGLTLNNREIASTPSPAGQGGLHDFNDKNSSGSLPLVLSSSVFLELGAKWHFSDTWLLYAGVYADYGLTDAVSSNGRPLIGWDNTDAFAVNSVLTSHYANYADNGRIVSGGVRPFMAGIKVALTFGVLSGKDSQQQQAMDEQNLRQQAMNNQLAEAKTEAARAVTAANKAAATSKQTLDAMKGLQEQMNSLQAQLKPQPAPTNATAGNGNIAAPNNDMEVLQQPIMNYGVDGIELTATMQIELDKKADILKKYPTLQIICTGYTCNLGAEDFNHLIGLYRAEATRNYFIQRGIDGKRIEVKSEGQHNPIAPNDSNANRQKNRRVEISVKPVK